MKAQYRSDQPLPIGWQWPVDLSRYDRSPLSVEEIEVLKRVELRPGKGKHRTAIKQPIRRQLRRLIDPVNDCLDFTKANHFARLAVTSVLIREMESHRSTFWEWTKSEWLEILGANDRDFKKTHKAPNCCRLDLMAVAYLLCDVTDFREAGRFGQRRVARKVFGYQVVENAIQTLMEEMYSWGYGRRRAPLRFPTIIAELLLTNRSPRLADLRPELLETVRQGKPTRRLQDTVFLISKALAGLGVFKAPLPAMQRQGHFGAKGAFYGVPPDWAKWCARWKEISTQAPQSRTRIYYAIQRVGRWLADKHPEITSPAQWTREIAAEYVAAVDRMMVGDYTYPNSNLRDRIGKPMTPRSKDSSLASMRTFFTDLQEWEWIPRRFNPARALATPRSVRDLIIPDPRVIADDVWAKLLHAGLNLSAKDLPVCATTVNPRATMTWYPIEMVRALTMVWLFAGLRQDEILRLRAGCIRRQIEDVAIPPTDEVLSQNSVCYLHVPTNKTSAAFTKPVDPLVGDAIEKWEQVRPSQPLALDAKTGELVHFLFSYRSVRIGSSYLNNNLIPLLCGKSGVPESDARGRITSHRARSTLATQLYNAKQPMTLFELMEWLGHRSPCTTQNYAKVTPTRLAKAYADADYFRRNLRTIEALIDQEAVRSGAAAQGKPWQYFDLGHGYCTYDYFSKCPHRMACAQCSFYVPKESSRAQMLEASANLQRMLKEISLTEEEIAAVESGIEFMNQLCQKLADVPTPDGSTPRELSAVARRELPILSTFETAKRHQESNAPR